MVLHYGTFNGHRLTMKVVAANLDLLAADGATANCTPSVTPRSPDLREVFRRRKDEGASCRDSARCSRSISRRASASTTIATTAATWTRSDTHVSFTAARPGIYMTPSNGLHWIISTAHTEKDIASAGRSGPGLRRPRMKARRKTATVFLGGGRITAALVAGFRLAGYDKPIIVHDRHPQKLRRLKQQYGVRVEPKLDRAVEQAHLLIIAVRPDSVRDLLHRINVARSLTAVSLAAGMPLAKLRQRLGPPVRWARAMPSPVCRSGRRLTAVVFDIKLSRSARQEIKGPFRESRARRGNSRGPVRCFHRDLLM